jgi:hypothetical protein
MRLHSVESYVFSLVGTYPIQPGFLFEVHQDKTRQGNNKEVANHGKDFDDGTEPKVDSRI